MCECVCVCGGGGGGGGVCIDIFKPVFKDI